jgi:hypothetical protein
MAQKLPALLLQALLTQTDQSRVKGRNSCGNNDPFNRWQKQTNGTGSS